MSFSWCAGGKIDWRKVIYKLDCSLVRYHVSSKKLHLPGVDEGSASEKYSCIDEFADMTSFISESNKSSSEDTGSLQSQYNYILGQ